VDLSAGAGWLAFARLYVGVACAIHLRSKFAFASRPAAQLLLEFFGCWPLVGTTKSTECSQRNNRGKKAFHPATLEGCPPIARNAIPLPQVTLLPVNP
jgi:hypothetical protein